MNAFLHFGQLRISAAAVLIISTVLRMCGPLTHRLLNGMPSVKVLVGLRLCIATIVSTKNKALTRVQLSCPPLPAQSQPHPSTNPLKKDIRDTTHLRTSSGNDHSSYTSYN